MAEDDQFRNLVGEVAAAYFSNSHVPPTDIPTVVQQIASSLGAVRAPSAPPEEPAAAEPTPPVQPKLTSAQIRKSITPDALISFEDGKPYKTLKRHLTTQGLSVSEYKAKWGLPKDYPLVAPSYSAARSAMAKAAGLGARRSVVLATPAPTIVAEPPKARRARQATAKAGATPAHEAPKRRGRKPAAPSPAGS
jgi:predicted transcriptional regulator